MAQLDPEELGRRLRAARAYKGLNGQDFAAALQISHSTVKRLEAGGGIDSLKEDALIDRAVSATDLPVEFFYVNWDELQRVWPPRELVQKKTPMDDAERERLIAASQLLAEIAQQPTVEERRRREASGDPDQPGEDESTPQ